MIATKFTLSLCAFLCVLIVGCMSNDVERIIGGTVAQQGQFPHIAALRLVTGETFCGAIIISRQFLLTAAHCTTGPAANPQHIRAFVGAHTNRDGRMHRVNRIIRHPRYNPSTRAYDAALLRLVIAIHPIAGRIQLARLPKQDLTVRTPLRARMAGWGYIRVSSIFIS